MKKGKINTRQKCPVCGEKFSPENQDGHGFYCPTCKTRPTRYYINARAFHCDYLYSNRQGEVFQTYSEALETLVSMNSAYKSKKFNPDDWIPAKVIEIRFENLVRTWLKNYEAELEKHQKSKSRVGGLKNICHSFLIPYFKGRELTDISREDIESFYHHLLDKGYSSRYIKDILDALKSVFLRYRRGNMPEFPYFSVVPAKEKQRLGLAREMQVMEHVPDRHGYRLAILVLLRTGMRINEVVALKKQDLIDGILYVDKAISEGRLRLSRKSGGLVTYKVTPELWQMLEDHTRDLRLEEYVFQYGGRSITTGRLYKVWKKACQDAQVNHISLQQASRHSRASEIMREYKQRALEEISRQLGHDNLTTGQKHYVVEGWRECGVDENGDKKE